MARLTYADLIARDERFTVLSDLGKRLSALDKALLMPRLVDLVPGEHLPLMAEKVSILGDDGYALATSDSNRRELIKGWYSLHRYKGTPYAAREIIRRLGFGEVELIEGLNNKYHDGSIKYDGTFVHGAADKWAYYTITFERPLTNAQADQIRRVLRAFTPARCVLAALDYKATALLHDGSINHDGLYNYGTV